MPPLRKPQRASSSFEPSDDVGSPQQAGRSATSLHAEVAASVVAREVQRPQSQGVYSSPSIPTLSRANSIPSLPSASSINSSVVPGSVNRRSSFIPTVSSPLNPNSAASTSSKSSIEQQCSDELSSGASTAPKVPALQFDPATRRNPVASSSRRPRSGGEQEMAETGVSIKPVAPTTIRELGSDYTRYFNPFSDSRRSSYMDLGGSTTPLPRYNSPGPELLAAQASGPEKSSIASTTRQQLSEKEAAPFSPFLDDRFGAPFNEKDGFKFPLYVDEKEEDDDMHMPLPDDDIRFKVRFVDHFSRENIFSTIGLILMLLGLLFIFAAVPALSFTGIFSVGYKETPLDQMWHGPEIETWAIVSNKTYPLLSNIRTTLIDPHTPQGAMTRTDINGQELELVFSDEFNDNNRSFYEGDDPYWFAPDIWYGATIDLDWYDPDAVTTYDGVLELRLDKFQNHGVQYRSGMLNSWNQLCFKGGVFEVSVSLPGPAGVPAFWPGAWTMGNLGRPGYLSTTDGLWPYTYNECDAGITPNQSMADGTSRLPGQRLNSCTCPGDDHPTPGTGRGAPEIDILEAGSNLKGLGIVTQSYQVAPFDIWYYPDYDFTEFPNYNISYPNGYTGGPYQQALSATTYVNNDWYDGKEYQKYAFEYVPGTGGDAYIAWYVGEQMTWRLNGNALGPNGNIGSRQISEEPMSLVLNMGFSTSWTYIDYAALADAFPTVLRVDYVRWYQPKGSTSVTCDPPGYETTEYIKDHMNAYTNPNLTRWNETGHVWPRNKLTSNC